RVANIRAPAGRARADMFEGGALCGIAHKAPPRSRGALDIASSPDASRSANRSANARPHRTWVLTDRQAAAKPFIELQHGDFTPALPPGSRRMVGAAGFEPATPRPPV